MVSLEYHHRTKHDFNRFARSLGYLDWAAQPNPFRRYEGAPIVALPRAVLRGDVPYDALFAGGVAPAPLDLASVGEFLRCAMGLSAWKAHGRSRWALRVNPSSGNLHPTEAFIVWNGRVCHYAPREHALDVRARLSPSDASHDDHDGDDELFLVGLTSIFWREAWKYGERAFRYCQHDVGHAIGALRCAGALLGWQVRMLDDWSDAEMATLLGLDREADFEAAEREEPECLLLVSPSSDVTVDRERLLESARHAAWSGRANRLSPSHVEWDAIDAVARATQSRGGRGKGSGERAVAGRREEPHRPKVDRLEPNGRQIILQRRSALGFDARSSLPLNRLLRILDRIDPAAAPFDAITWPPQVHLVLFVHRVDGLAPGVYVYLRDPAAGESLRAAFRAEFLWEPIEAEEHHPSPRLFLLVPADVRFTANRLSCDQDIASDGFFSLGMLARVEPALQEYGEWFYRRLFWECGLIGQVLYLEAEAAGARSTGIGCFYDDRVHELLGLQDATWQSLYHFSMGVPVDDDRIATTAGYEDGW